MPTTPDISRGTVVSQRETRIEETPHFDAGTLRGHVGLYFNGATSVTDALVTGQFRLLPGEEPHPIHTHEEEELLIVTSGVGEIVCDGKTTRVEAGAVMYTAPHVPHGITNTGDEVLTFYFIKWVARRE